ncbi:uncharacterized protein LOC125045058 [Penaeus chinensis]|uniref:uncharacterized protein LOC125045058 n=1 Tax=Penaeus chinensis TaxID=139456 RepID=UPI001FB60E51|nr:uncharacterized protein LOC125045058 [Penaeus chinensis]
MILGVVLVALVAGAQGEAVAPSPYLGFFGSSVPVASRLASTSQYSLTVQHGAVPRANSVSAPLKREKLVKFDVDDTTLYREDVGDGPSTHEESSEEVQRRQEGFGKSSTRPFHPRIDTALPPQRARAAAPSVPKVETPAAVPVALPVQAQVAVVSPASAKVIVPVVPAAVSPLVTTAPQVTLQHGVVKQQFHAQDELGRYAFGYSGGPSSRAETRDALGHVRGSFSYVDPHGKIQYQHYVADDHGFRITSASNLPQQRRKRSAETSEDQRATEVDAIGKARSHKAHSGTGSQAGTVSSPGFASHPGSPSQSPFALQHFLSAQPNSVAQPANSAHSDTLAHFGFPSQSGILVRPNEIQTANSAHSNFAHLGPAVQTSPGTGQSSLPLHGSFAHQHTPLPVSFAVQPVNSARQGATSFQNAAFQGAVATPSNVAFQGAVTRPSSTAFVGTVPSSHNIPFQSPLIHQDTTAQSQFVAVPGSRTSTLSTGAPGTVGFPSTHGFAGQGTVFGNQGSLTAPGSFTPTGTPSFPSGDVAIFVDSDFLQSSRGILQGLGRIPSTPGFLTSASGTPGILDVLGNQGNSGFSYGFEEGPTSVQTFGSHFNPGRQ